MRTNKIYSAIMVVAAVFMGSVIYGQSCDTLRNYIPPANNIYTIWGNSGSGMLLGQDELTAGTDVYQVAVWAEPYDIGAASKTIRAVSLLPSVIKGTTGQITIQVYSDNAGVPGSVIGSQVVNFSDLQSPMYWSVVPFQTPVNVTGKFYVGYTVPYTTPVDSFQLATTEPATNYTMLKITGAGTLNNTWHNVSDVYKDASNNPINSAFAMDILFSNASDPVANFTITNGTVACEGGTFNVDGSSSTGTIDSYQWLLIDLSSNIYDTGTGVTSTLTTTANSPNLQIVGLVAYGACIDSVKSVLVTVNDPVTATINTKDATCSTQGEISITGATGGSGTYQYSIDGGATYQSGGTFSSLTASTYNIEVKTNGIGCSYTTTAQINAIPPATLSVGSGQTICKGAQASLTASTNGGSNATIDWFDGTTKVATGTSVQLSPTATTTYDVKLTDTNGCVVTNQVTVTVDFADPSFNYSSNTICSGAGNQTPTVTTNGGTFTVNNTGLIFANASTGEIDVAGSTPGTYKVYYSVTSGACTYKDSANITITSNPDATFSYAQSSYCSGTGTVMPTFPIGASAGTFSATPAGLTIDASNGKIDLANSAPGTYTVQNQISITGCTSSTKTTTVTINATPTINAGQDVSVCQGDQVTLTASASAGTVTWDKGVSDNVAFAPSVTDTYTATATNNGCSATDQVKVTVNPLPTVDAGQDQTLCTTDAAITLTGTPAGGTFSGNGVAGNNFDPAIAGVGPHTITYTYQDGNGCSNTDMITITVDKCAGINENEIHSIVISPNPANDNVIISMENSTIENVSLVALDGQIVRVDMTIIDSKNVKLDVSSVARGTYLLHITTAKGQMVQKLIVK